MKHMMLVALVGALVFSAHGSEVMAEQSASSSGYSAKVKKHVNGRRHVFVQPSDQVFPHIAMGGGWETVMVIMNLSETRIDFEQDFYAQDGSPMEITALTIPEGTLIKTAGAKGFLSPKASFHITLFNDSPQVRAGWASLDYDSSQGRLGGYVIFRQRIAGRPDFEALVPLSGYDDAKFYMAFDNTRGFDTSIALVNPATNIPCPITLTFMTTTGTIIAQDTLTLPPGGQTAFSLPSRVPQVADRVGMLYVESTTTRLTGVGLRFNTAGGNSFANIPIMNWSGMFK